VGSTLSSPATNREKALRSLGELPPFSPILNKLLATLADDGVSFAKLSELIEKDTVLAGNVLRLVNSALYGRRGTINSVRHAVSLMGVTKLRNSAMTLSVSRVWNEAKTPKGWPAARFNLHSAATGVLSDILAQRMPVHYAEGAFIAGLLHDLGLLLIAIALPEEYKEIRRLHEEEEVPLAEAERQVLGFDHAELSAAALAEWNIPEPVQKAVRYQWEPQRQTGDEVPLSRVLNAAGQVVDALGITVLGDETAGEVPATVFEPFGLEDQTQEIVEEFQAEFDSIRAFF
jgi:HD-like signal output (HDOD) protein